MVGSMRPSQLFKPWISFHDSLKGGSSKLPNVSSSWSSSGVRLEAEEEHLRVSEGLVFGKKRIMGVLKVVDGFERGRGHGRLT